jgi:hypothetical protein
MAKRRSTTNIPQDNTPDFLVKPKKQFEADLNERIKIGLELIERQVTSSAALGKLHSDYTFWHDFNCEFLNRAFNKINNQYFKEYTWEPSIYVGSMYPSTPTFAEMVQDVRSDISKHLIRLQKIKEKLILIDELPGLEPEVKEPDKLEEGLAYLNRLFSKFHRAAQTLRHRHGHRETLIIKDEYDVQDLLRSFLNLHFDDIREEDYSPSYAGGNSRIDFVLKDEEIVIETKMTNDHLRDKEVGSQLLIDIGRYRGHPACKVLVVFVYDKGDHIRNKNGLINDLQRMSSSELIVKVYIEPK